MRSYFLEKSVRMHPANHRSILGGDVDNFSVRVILLYVTHYGMMQPAYDHIYDRMQAALPPSVLSP